MTRTKRRRGADSDVDPFTDKLVIGFFALPLFPVALWLARMNEAPNAAEVPGLISIGVVLWGIAGLIAWRGGGKRYVVEALCVALVMTPFLPWVIAVVEGWPPGSGLAGLLVATALPWALAAVLAWCLGLSSFAAPEHTKEKGPQV